MHECNQNDSKLYDMPSCMSNPNQDFTSGNKNLCMNNFVLEYDQECCSHLQNFQMKGSVSESYENSWDECSSLDGSALDDFMDNSCYNSDYEDDFSI